MSGIKRWVTKYFGFSRAETNGFLILLPLMTVVIFSEPVYHWWLDSLYRPADNTKRLDSLVALWNTPRPADSAEVSHRDFPFDPNTASAGDFVSLGLPKKMAQRIIAYRAKGGRFRIKSDLKKIYGIDSIWLALHYPFVTLPEKTERPERKPADRSRKLPVAAIRFDLNNADTSQLIGVYGIGSRLARRITAYRSRLGGFISLDQLTEIYGLDSAVIIELKKKAFIAVDFSPRQININRAGKKELSRLPYISFSLANSIASYRFSHGDFQSLDDLMRLVLMDKLTFQRIKPYLTIKE
jgi:competence protein ComEA